jgi:CheY-like chemotaxis protein
MTLEDHERYKVLTASDGQEALAICQREHPELVFLDMQMPKLDGIDVCLHIRSQPDIADTTVVMLTALARDADIERTMEAGADDYMTKPFSPTDLHKKLVASLGLPDADFD